MRLLLLVAAISAFAQETAPPAPELTDAEKQFQDSMENVKLVGKFTLGDGADLHDDAYTIVRVRKIKEDTWKFEARIQYNKKDVPVAMNLPVRFAGDTPVISLTNFSVPGFGSFTARVVIYSGTYAGTWSSASGNTNGRGANLPHGGMLFGKVVKNDATSAQQ